MLPEKGLLNNGPIRRRLWSEKPDSDLPDYARTRRDLPTSEPLIGRETMGNPEARDHRIASTRSVRKESGGQCVPTCSGRRFPEARDRETALLATPDPLRLPPDKRTHSGTLRL